MTILRTNVLLLIVTSTACVSKLPIAGASCPCPRGYCCESGACVLRSFCQSPIEPGIGEDPIDGSDSSPDVLDGGAEAPAGAIEMYPDAAAEAATDGIDGYADAEANREDAFERIDVADAPDKVDGADTVDATGGADGPPSGGKLVNPWPDGTPGYTRAIVKVGDCTGIAIDQNWILTADSCHSKAGDLVISPRPTGNVISVIDRWESHPVVGEDSALLHVQPPFTDLPAVPLFWGDTAAVVGESVTCYGRGADGLRAATLLTRPHADQTTNPGTFETVRDGTDPTVIPGGGGGPCFLDDRLIAVDNSWLTDRTGGLETSIADFRSWMIAVMRGQRAKLFQAFPDETVYSIDNNSKLWRDDQSAASRTLIDATVADFRAIDATLVYVLGYDNNLWRETPDSGHRTLVDGNTATVEPIDEAVAYVVGRDRNLWREVGTFMTRTLVDTQVLAFHAVGTSHVFVLDYDRTLWNDVDDFSARTRVDTKVVDFWPVTGTTAYVLRDDFSLWHEVGGSSTATLVDTGVLDMQPIDDSLIYVLSQDGTLWRIRGTSADRDRVDSVVVAFQPVDATTVYVLDQDGNVWREQGNSASRTLVERR